MIGSTREITVFLAIQEHLWNDADVVLPLMTALVPLLPFDYFGRVDLIDCPEVRVAFVEEDILEDVVVVGERTSLIGLPPLPYGSSCNHAPQFLYVFSCSPRAIL